MTFLGQVLLEAYFLLASFHIAFRTSHTLHPRQACMVGHMHFTARVLLHRILLEATGSSSNLADTATA